MASASQEIRYGLPAAALALVAAFGACNSRPTGQATVAAKSEPVLVFSDDFERPELGNDWLTAKPEAWKIEAGWISGANAKNDGLWLQTRLPENVRIEFKAKALSADGDLKFEVFTDGRTHQTGYIGIFGGWRNQLNIIARLDEHGEDRLVGAAGVKVEVGRVYQMSVERTDHRVRWKVDGNDFLIFADAAPLRGAGHEFFGFNDWTAPVQFDEVRVYDLGPNP